MGESCVFKPTVKNKKGEEVNSKLFDSLLHFSSNDREFAKKWYFIGTNDEFLRANSDRVLYDENGEITFLSLKNLVSLELSSDKILKLLNKDLGFGEHEYSEAISLMTSFNNTNPYNDLYMAVIGLVENGKTTLLVVKRTPKNELSLEENITNKTLFDRIKLAVERIGGSISFIDEEYSKYDTINAKKAESGLYNVIFLSKKGNLTTDMAEEAGHFAVGALGNNPLVKRLESLCTPEVQLRVLGDHYRDVLGRKNPRRETAGFLVGLYIMNLVDLEPMLKRLVGRIVNLAKKMFYKLTLDSVGLMRLEALNIAKSIARGFMSGENAGSVELALLTKEVLYSATDSTSVSAFKDIILQLNLLTTLMAAIDRTLYKKWNSIEAETAIGRLFENPSYFADMIAIDGITVALTLLVDSTPEMIELLDSVNYNANEVPANAKKLRLVRQFVQSSVIIMDIINNMLASSDVQLNEDIKDKLENAYSTLSSLIKGPNRLEANLLKKERNIYLSFLKEIYGGEYINRAARVVFNFNKFSLLERVLKSQESISRALETLDKDDNLMNRYLASMADSGDIINQLAYKAKASATKFADDNTIKAWNDVRVLEQDIKDLKVDTRRLLERSLITDELTGNFISKYNWGDWENDWQKFKNQCKEDFLKDPSIEGKTQIEKEYLWDVYFRPLSKDWHKSHSKYDQASGRYMPSDLYFNISYNFLTANEKHILDRILEIKQSCDDLLRYLSYNGEIVEVAHTNLYRMPLFRGSTLNRIENIKRTHSTGKAIGRVLRLNIINTFVINSEDRDYGSAVTHNVIDEDVFSDRLDFEKLKINRVPLYGINKLKDMSELSTDICNGLLLYAAMANTYNATSAIVDILEVGKNVLSNRRVEGLKREVDRDTKSRVFSRYCDFLDALVYNLYANGNLTLGKVAIHKIVGFFSGLASKVFLGGNVAGGAVNAMTGFNEITKEAIAGETYTLSDLVKAEHLYFKYLPYNLLLAGKAVKNDKISLFMRKFNVQNNLEALVKLWSTRKSRLTRLNPFGDNLMLPYKSGDHFMQTMSYLAAANHYKFIDKDGNKMSLWEALEERYIDEDNPKAGKTLEFKEDILYIDPKTKEHREWSMDDEVKFCNLCRETNNRMHGIYNRMDRTGFHNTIYGLMVLAMRGYALGLLYRRFSTNLYNISLGRESEGSLVTASKVFLNMFGGFKNIWPSLRAIVCPFGNSTKNSLIKMGFSEELYRNMRRNWSDFALIGILWLIKALTAPSGGDDEDDDEEDDGLKNRKTRRRKTSRERREMEEDGDVALGLIYYFASRLYMEQNAYNTPWGIWLELKSVLDWMPSGVSVAGLIAEISKLIITLEEYKKDSKLHLAGDKKWEYKVGTYIPYYRSTRVLEHPYESAKSYEYGRVTYK